MHAQIHLCSQPYPDPIFFPDLTPWIMSVNYSELNDLYFLLIFSELAYTVSCVAQEGKTRRVWLCAGPPTSLFGFPEP